MLCQRRGLSPHPGGVISRGRNGAKCFGNSPVSSDRPVHVPLQRWQQSRARQHLAGSGELLRCAAVGVILSTCLLGRWLGWWVIASGIGLAISRFSWTLEFWFFRTSPSGSG
jgi:hypothetical protein